MHGLVIEGDVGARGEEDEQIVLEFSEDEDLMLCGVDRGGLVNPHLSHVVLFPELSFCRYSVSDSSGTLPSPPLEIP